MPLRWSRTGPNSFYRNTTKNETAVATNQEKAYLSSIVTMDQSSLYDFTKNTRNDAPPSRPERSTSRYVKFTRSQLFSSIYRPEENPLGPVRPNKKRHQGGVRIRLMGSASVLFLLVVGSYTTTMWHSLSQYKYHQRNGQTTFVSTNGQSRELIDSHSSTSSSKRLDFPTLPVISTHKRESTDLPWPSFLTLHQGAIVSQSTGKEISSCIVTAYFRVHSKHSDDSYDRWMRNMLSLEDCMIIFCDAEMVETMLQYRSAKTNSATAVVAVKLSDLPVAQFSGNMTNPARFWQRQLKIDPERKLHKSYHVFWIWLSKSWFVVTAALLQKQLFSLPNATIDTWVWADIGSFRDEKYINNQLIHQDATGLFPDKNTVLWMAHRTPNPPSDPFWNRKLVREEKQHFYQSGSQAAAASVKAWTTFHAFFIDTFEKYSDRGLFVGEDQCVIQTTCLLHPSSCAYVPFDQVPDNKYFGLRYMLHNALQVNLWRPPSISLKRRL